MRVTDEQLVNNYYETIVGLQEARAKITNLEASLSIKDYLIAELEMKLQVLKYKEGV